VAVSRNKVFYYYLLPLTQYMFRQGSNQLRRKRKYSPEDGPHGPKHVVSEWKEIIKNFVAIDGHYNKVLYRMHSSLLSSRPRACRLRSLLSYRFQPL
jgi:hypothetical protein